ncbi:MULTISPECIES: hypothetical protein [unclassified Microcoleus]
MSIGNRSPTATLAVSNLSSWHRTISDMSRSPVAEIRVAQASAIVQGLS